MYYQWAQGGDLLDQISHISKSKAYAPEALVLHVILELAQALAYLHEGLRWDESTGGYVRMAHFLKIVHGDIKPDNVFLDWTETT